MSGKCRWKMTVLTVTPYEPRHRQKILDLFYRAYQVHLHLDWYTAEQWLDRTSEIIRLAWDDRTLVGVIGAAQPLNATSWMRLLMLRDRASARTVLLALWESTRRVLAQAGVRSVWLLLSNESLTDEVRAMGFAQDEWVITLRRHGLDFPEPLTTAVELRPLELDEIKQVTAVDQTAFAPPWQLSAADLYQAVRQSDSAKCAWLNGEIIGYQLSTRYRESGHLARLAVLPHYQGQGIGGALIRDMLGGFLRRHVMTVTVNTQQTNIQSQRLYEYYGFERNHFDLPVWKIELDAPDEADQSGRADPSVPSGNGQITDPE